MFSKLNKIQKNFLLFLSLTFVLTSTAVSAERAYYSIHIASFKKLETAQDKVNSLEYLGETVFLKITDIPGESKFYRVYLGKYGNSDEAVAYWKKLKKIGTVNHLGIHYFTETIKPPEKEIVRKILLPKKVDANSFYAVFLLTFFR